MGVVPTSGLVSSGRQAGGAGQTSDLNSSQDISLLFLCLGIEDLEGIIVFVLCVCMGVFV